MSLVSKLALIGAGFIAHTHAEAIASIPGLTLSAVCDVDSARGRAFGDAWSVPVVVNSLDELLSDHRPDAAHVLVPPHLHRRVAETLLKAGVPVLLEKPMALSVEDCDALIDVAKKSGVRLGVNHNALFHPSVSEMTKEIDARRIGKVEHVSASVSIPLRQLDAGQIGHWMFQEPGNLAMELLPHTLSVVERLLGPVEDLSVLLSGRRPLSSGVELPRTWQVSLICRSGTAQVFFQPGSEFEEWWVTVTGQDGSLRADLTYDLFEWRGRTRWLPALDQFLVGHRNGRLLKRFARKGFLDYAFSKIGLKSRCDSFFVGMKESIRAYHDALKSGGPFPGDAERAREVVRMCEKVSQCPAIESYKNGAVAAKEEKAEGAESSRSMKQVKDERRVLVTGATGFIGGHLVEKLTGLRPVTALVRRTSGLPGWLDSGIDLVNGDIADEAALQEAVKGVETVVHLATGGGNSWSEIEESMVGGAVRVGRAAIQSGAHLIYASSIAALYLGDDREVITEETPCDPSSEKRALYARAKALAEKKLFQLVDQEGLSLTVIRPGVVVGRRGSAYHSGVGYWINSQHCLGFSSGKHPLAFVLVEDVADAFIQAIELPRKEAMSKIFNLVGDVRLTSREYIDELVRVSGRPVSFHPHSPFGLQLVDSAKWMIKRVGGQKVPFPSLRDFKSRGMPARFDCSHTLQTLKWSPVSDRDEFIKRALAVHFQEAREVLDASRTAS